MRSSTSGSDSSAAARAAAALLAGCLAIAGLSEAVVRIGFDRVSRIQRRTAAEHRAALSPRAPWARRTVLFVGNSLLDEGVDFDVLRQRLAPEWEARRFVVEQTFYHDWYYGLRRLFDEGARPDVVVVMLTARQWTRDQGRGDYSAHYLMSVADAARASRELHMHPTQASSFVLASMSRFWGARAEIRNFLLGRMMPDLGRLMEYSSVADETPMQDAIVERIARDRLERCRDLARAHGATLAALEPPLLNPADGAKGLIQAGKHAGVPVFAPVASGTYQGSYYRDAGFHMNAAGARAFTDTLAAYLTSELAAVDRGTHMVATR